MALAAARGLARRGIGQRVTGEGYVSRWGSGFAGGVILVGLRALPLTLLRSGCCA